MRTFFLNLFIMLLMEAKAEAQNACFQARCQFSPGNYFAAARAVIFTDHFCFFNN